MYLVDRYCQIQSHMEHNLYLIALSVMESNIVGHLDTSWFYIFAEINCWPWH